MSTTNEEKHQEAYAGAEAAVRALAPADIAARTGLLWVPVSIDPEDPGAGAQSPAGHFDIAAFGSRARLSWPDLSFESPSPLLKTFPWRLIALHHLAIAGGAEPGEDWVSYRELPDGLFYANTITREVEEPLARLFGADPAAFLAAGESLGGTPLRLADVALVFHPLPRVPVVFALWREDEEFPAKIKVLYERVGAAGLPLQDLRIVAELAGAGMKAAAGPR
jgi:hypothetical protein